jgi:hypothetical protein
MSNAKAKARRTATGVWRLAVYIRGDVPETTDRGDIFATHNPNAMAVHFVASSQISSALLLPPGCLMAASWLLAAAAIYMLYLLRPPLMPPRLLRPMPPVMAWV